MVNFNSVGLCLLGIVLVLCLAGGGGDKDDGRDDGAGDGPGGKLELRISCENLTVQSGSRPKIAVTITNRGDKPVNLVVPGGGSSRKWRTPIVGWSVISANEPDSKHPSEPPLHKGLGCGNINSLKPGEVFVLKKGDQKELSDWLGLLSFPGPGKYRVVFYYSNDPSIEWKGIPLGKHDEKTMERVKNSTKCALISNELIFTVEGTDEEAGEQSATSDGDNPEGREIASSSGQQMASNQTISCDFIAEVRSIESMEPEEKIKGYVIDEDPKWTVELKVLPHEKKIPFQPSVRRCYIANVEKVFGSPREEVAGTYQFTYTWNVDVPGRPEFENFKAEKIDVQKKSAGGGIQ